LVEEAQAALADPYPNDVTAYWLYVGVGVGLGDTDGVSVGVGIGAQRLSLITTWMSVNPS